MQSALKFAARLFSKEKLSRGGGKIGDWSAIPLAIRRSAGKEAGRGITDVTFGNVRGHSSGPI